MMRNRKRGAKPRSNRKPKPRLDRVAFFRVRLDKVRSAFIRFPTMHNARRYREAVGDLQRAIRKERKRLKSLSF